jgi:hypothetical protein
MKTKEEIELDARIAENARRAKLREEVEQLRIDRKTPSYNMSRVDAAAAGVTTRLSNEGYRRSQRNKCGKPK